MSTKKTEDPSAADERFDQWCIVELFGHQKLAGRVRSQTIGGASFIRLDIPAGNAKQQPVTKILSPSAIYCLTPVTEKTARMAASRLPSAPMTAWDVQALIDAAPKRLPSRDPED